MRVLVTGGAGFIGSTVTARLLAAGMDVVVLDDLSTGSLANLDACAVGHDRLTVVRGSVLDRAAVDAACAGVASVVHLAAHVSVPESVHRPRLAYDANVTGTITVLEAARAQAAQVLIASSASVYGPGTGAPQREDQLPRPVSPYAASKLAAEHLALTWQACYQLPTLVLRFFNVFGPRQLATDAYAAAVPAFVTQALAGRTLEIHGDGRQTRDFVPVGTVAEVVARAVTERTCWPAPVNVALGRSASLLEVVADLAEILGRPLEVHHGPARPGDVPSSCGDGTLLRQIFPDLATPDLRAALAETVAWHAARATPAQGPPRRPAGLPRASPGFRLEVTAPSRPGE